MIDLVAQTKPLLKRILAGWRMALETGAFIMGPQVKAFEQEAAKFLGVKHAITCNSGTDALFILLRAAGVGPGDEVVVPAFSFFATAEAVSIVGAKPIFCDIDPLTYHLDISKLDACLSPRSKAVIPVHLYGLPMDLAPLRGLLKGRRIAIIEDACQSFGAKVGGKSCGTLGDAAAFSFYPTKNLSAAGDAGMMTTNDDTLAARARMLREHGSPKRYTHELVGYNSRLDEVQAVVLRAKLPKVARWNALRRKVASAYLKDLRDLPLILPKADAACVWHQFTLRVEGGQRDVLQAHLRLRDVASAVFYPGPMHTQAPYRADKTHSPQADKAATEVLCLPIYPELSQAQIKAVILGVRSFFETA